jgi:glycosyltransferase involved in cell wall biosynthesis
VALISAITTCKGRLAHLQQTLPALMRTGMEVVVVDYDCPDGAGAWVQATYRQARVVAVTERPRFNLSAARNLGAAAASGEWLLFLDADVSVDPGLPAAIERDLRPGVFLLADPRPPELWGVLLVSRTYFDAVEGYDGVFEGWGAEDVDLVERLEIRGLRPGSFPGGLLTSIPHGDAQRTQFHEIADTNLSASINGFYRIAKNNLARHGDWLGLDARRRLYAHVREAMLGTEAVKTIQIPVRSTMVENFFVDVFLRYDFRPRNPES